LEEYDFRNDTEATDIDIDLKPSTRLRVFQEKVRLKKAFKRLKMMIFVNIGFAEYLGIFCVFGVMKIDKIVKNSQQMI
jgi:hypothetical protein